VSLIGRRFFIQSGTAVKKRKEHIMRKCLDSFHTSFNDFETMFSYHENQSKDSVWCRTAVKNLQVAPLDKTSSLYGTLTKFASNVSEEAVHDTADNLGLAIKINRYYPLRDTSFKSLTDRAKISGSALPKLNKPDLAKVLNSCLKLHSANALLLIRDEKISAAHSGDEKDYSVLEINRLLESISDKLTERFPGHNFDSGYTDHSMTSASWSLPGQCEEILGTYKKVLDSKGKSAMAAKLMPGIRFCTSDTGMASAKTAALLLGLTYPIHIGGMLAVEHRGQAKIEDFTKNLDMMFAQFGNAISMLEKLTEIYLDYPVNAMTAICKKLSMPKKAALEAIAMFEGSLGSSAVTAHDIFMAMQEIIFILRTEGISEGKLLLTEENLARALTLRWSDFDYAKAVNY